MNTKKNDNLSVAEIISFVGLLLMGVLVFFGMHFQTMGDKVLSIVVTVLLTLAMLVFVFLAAYAKAQNKNQSIWRTVEYSMLILYGVALIPCYFFVTKFMDIYLNKESITKQVQVDINSIDQMFTDYKKVCQSRCNSYQITLESMLKDRRGRDQLAELLELGDEEPTQKHVLQAAESFSNMLVGDDYKRLEAEKNNLENNLKTHIMDWNILLLPQYASEMVISQIGFGIELVNIYTKHQNSIEENIPEFTTTDYLLSNQLQNTFTRNPGFSIMGLIAMIVLGGLGLVKYLLGEQRTVIGIQKGDANTIIEDGGITI